MKALHFLDELPLDAAHWAGQVKLRAGSAKCSILLGQAQHSRRLAVGFKCRTASRCRGLERNVASTTMVKFFDTWRTTAGTGFIAELAHVPFGQCHDLTLVRISDPGDVSGVEGVPLSDQHFVEQLEQIGDRIKWKSVQSISISAFGSLEDAEKAQARIRCEMESGRPQAIGCHRRHTASAAPAPGGERAPFGAGGGLSGAGAAPPR
jgi:hypothetical protein